VEPMLAGLTHSPRCRELLRQHNLLRES
jgi:hypothetical protein